MSALVLDAGALIALDRNDRGVWAMLRAAADDDALVRVPAGALGQVWRHGARQALLARALRHCEEVPLDGAQARAAGTLCRATTTHDVIDASVALVAAGVAADGVTPLLTSDPAELSRLLDVLDAEQVRIVPV
ncbi:MAG: hypothetical protein ACRDZ4_19745 [Egibacteraceae bacterium]